MKTNRLSLLLLIGVFAFSGCHSSSGNKDQSTSPTSEQPGPSSNPKNIPYEDVYPNYDAYYSDYDFQTLVGDDLKLEMHKYFILEHQTYITYDNWWYYVDTGADAVPNTERNELFYTNKQVDRIPHSNQDREHVWPCASSNGLWRRYSAGSTELVEHNIDESSTKFKYWGAGSDLYHVRPATSSVNQKRSDASFYDFDDSELSDLIRLYDGGPYVCYVNTAKNKFEVDDHVKGDVARIIMYLWVHYNQMGAYNVYYSPDHTPVYSLNEGISEEGHSPYVCGMLSLTSVMAYPTEQECMEKLVEWNQIDPPSAVEVNRNNYVQTVQGNRNPFVDYPQLVEHMLFE